MFREALNNQVGKQKESFWAHTELFGCNKISKDQKTRFEVEVLKTVWYQGKGHLIMFIETNIRKLNWNTSSIYITDKEYFNLKHDC